MHLCIITLSFHHLCKVTYILYICKVLLFFIFVKFLYLAFLYNTLSFPHLCKVTFSFIFMKLLYLPSFPPNPLCGVNSIFPYLWWIININKYGIFYINILCLPRCMEHYRTETMISPIVRPTFGFWTLRITKLWMNSTSIQLQGSDFMNIEK